jgi:hypothetical protein
MSWLVYGSRTGFRFFPQQAPIMLKAIRRWLLDRKLRRAPVLPRLKHTAFLKAVERMSMALDRQPVPSDQFPISRPFLADIIVTFGLDLGDKYVALTPALLDRARLDPAQLYVTAIRNLFKQIGNVGLKEDDGVFRMRAAADHSACLALLDDLWEEAAKQLGGDLVAAIPNRNTLLYARADNPSAVHRLKQQAKIAFHAEPPHGISQHLLLWKNHAWTDQGRVDDLGP